MGKTGTRDQIASGEFAQRGTPHVLTAELLLTSYGNDVASHARLSEDQVGLNASSLIIYTGELHKEILCTDTNQHSVYNVGIYSYETRLRDGFAYRLHDRRERFTLAAGTWSQ